MSHTVDLPSLMRDTAHKLALINAKYGLPANAPVGASWLRHEAQYLEEQGEK